MYAEWNFIQLIGKNEIMALAGSWMGLGINDYVKQSASASEDEIVGSLV